MPAFQLMAEAVEEKKKFQRRSCLGSVQWLFELTQTTMSEYTHSKIFLPSPPPSGKVIFMHLAHGLFNFFWRQPDLQHQEHKHRNGRKRRSSPTLAGTNSWPSDSDLVGKRQPGHRAGGLHRGTDVMIARGLSERLAGARFLALLTSCHSSALHA